MKKRIFFGCLFIVFFMELAVLVLLAYPKAEKSQDTVAVNEIVKTVQNDWKSLQKRQNKHINPTNLEYVVLGLDGTVLYRTKAGLSESIHAAISHKDTILDIKIQGLAAGKILIYNNDAIAFRSEKQIAVFAVIATMILQCGICAVYYLYIRHVIIQPFDQMKDFAKRVAGGNFDIPLKMDRENLFGAFTESFDLMRSELKKAKIAEASANAGKKELVAKLSHDIKTPVASIKAASEVGVAIAADEKSKENYQQIIQKADQINTLVTNLFSATLEELHELAVTPSELNSQEVYDLLINADYLHRANIPSVPACLLYADRLRLQQVFDNIFANSYKYANTNINVTIDIVDAYLTVSMEDYGGGICASELPLLKEKFKRGSNTENIEGAGLGLYIADYCMKKMKGRMDVTNGSTGLKVTIWIALCNTI